MNPRISYFSMQSIQQIRESHGNIQLFQKNVWEIKFHLNFTEKDLLARDGEHFSCSTFLPIACLLKFENILLLQLAFSYSKLKVTTCYCSCFCLIVDAVVVVIILFYHVEFLSLSLITYTIKHHSGWNKKLNILSCQIVFAELPSYFTNLCLFTKATLVFQRRDVASIEHYWALQELLEFSTFVWLFFPFI